MAGQRLEIGGFLDGMMKAAMDKYGQVDIRLKGLTLDWKGTPLGFELNGKVTITLHMRELTDPEKKAHREENLASIRR